MKFQCEQCNAKYTIPDERISGKKLKIRCKKCGAIISVQAPATGVLPAHPLTGQREAVTGEYMPVSKVIEVAPAASQAAQPRNETVSPSPQKVAHHAPSVPPPDAVPPPPPSRPPVEWFYSKGGKQMGPVGSSEMKELIWSRVIGPKTFVWCDGMEDWARLSTVTEFEAEIKGVGEEQDKKVTDAGVFDSLLKDVGHTAAAGPAQGAWIETPSEKESASAAMETPRADLAEAVAVVEEASRAHVAVKIEETPFGGGSRGEARDVSEGDIFESAIREEMERQAREMAEKTGEPVVKTQSYLPVQVVEAGTAVPTAAGQPESTRVVILKAGFSTRNRVKRFAVAAGITAAILAGFTWIITSQKSLTFIKTIAQKVTKSEYSTPASPEESDMTPEEREHFRKAMLGLEEKKKEEARKKHVQRGTQPSVKGGEVAAVDPRLKDAYQGIAKEGEFAPTRIDFPTTAEPGGGVGNLGTSVGGAAGLDLGRQEARADFRPEVAAAESRYSTDQINRVITGNQRKLRYCSEKYVKPGTDLSGKVQFRAEVKGSGEVSKVRNLTERIKGTMVEECLLKEIRTWQFPRFDGDATSVDMTLILTAGM